MFIFIVHYHFICKGTIVDVHGKVIQVLDYDSNWESPAYTGPNQVIGPGFAPFKPYLRPGWFYLRVCTLCFHNCLLLLIHSCLYLFY